VDAPFGLPPFTHKCTCMLTSDLTGAINWKTIVEQWPPWLLLHYNSDTRLSFLQATDTTITVTVTLTITKHSDRQFLKVTLPWANLYEYWNYNTYQHGTHFRHDNQYSLVPQFS